MLKSISCAVTGLLILSSTAFAKHVPHAELPDLTGSYFAILQTCMTPGSASDRIEQRLEDTYVRLDNAKVAQGSPLDNPTIANVEVRVSNRTSPLAHSLLRLLKTATSPDTFPGSYFKQNVEKQQFETGVQSALIFSDTVEGMFSINEFMISGKTNVIGNNLCATGQISSVFMFLAPEKAFSK